jgi:hypothetical protein
VVKKSQNKIRAVIILKSCLCFSAAVLCFSLVAGGETIVFKSGKIETAPIVERNAEYVKVDFQGIPITYYIDDIETINGREPDFFGDPQLIGADFNDLLGSSVYELEAAAVRLPLPAGWIVSGPQGGSSLTFSPGDGEGFAKLTITALPQASGYRSQEEIMLEFIEEAKKNANAAVEIIDFAGTSAMQSLISDEAYMKEIRFVKDGVLFTISALFDVSMFKKWSSAIDQSLAAFKVASLTDSALSRRENAAVSGNKPKRSLALENVAGSALYTIVSAQYTYFLNNGRFATLEELGEGKLPYIDKELAAGKKMGYRYDLDLNDETFYATARPETSANGLEAGFYIDERGLLCKSYNSEADSVKGRSLGSCPSGYGRLK